MRGPSVGGHHDDYQVVSGHSAARGMRCWAMSSTVYIVRHMLAAITGIQTDGHQQDDS
ncbi:hypothetical protein CGRA01v4_13952 [Colletotrichum graminicola]|nr:hypothetical protein CGRA01v4_13952 [Colletotrichum graminicola]